MEVERNIQPPLARSITIVPNDDRDLAIYVAVTVSRSAYSKRDWDSVLRKLATKVESIVNGRLWVVGQLLTLEVKVDGAWQFLGLFDSEASASAVCTTANHFYAETGTNKLVSGNLKDWPRVVFPLRAQ